MHNYINKKIFRDYANMKKKIIFGSILSIIILMSLPSIPAIEFNNAVYLNNEILNEKILNEKICFILNKINKINYIFLKNSIDFDEKNINKEILGSQSIVSFVIVRYIIRILFAIINGFIDITSFVIQKAVNLFINILRPILKISLIFLIAYFTIAAIIDMVFLVFFLFLSVLK